MKVLIDMNLSPRWLEFLTGEPQLSPSNLCERSYEMWGHETDGQIIDREAAP
jgi:predicted nuclease of predicted toxin-antitoxin system